MPEKFPGESNNQEFGHGKKELVENKEKEWRTEIETAGAKCGGAVIKDSFIGTEYLIPKEGLGIKFIEPQLQFSAADLPAGFDQNLFSDEVVDNDFKEAAQQSFNKLLDFLTGPIITDNLDKTDEQGEHQVKKIIDGKKTGIEQKDEHPVRRCWETEYATNHLAPATKHYYQSNRLAVSSVNSLRTLFATLDIRNKWMIKNGQGSIFKDDQMIRRLEGMLGKLPAELKEENFLSYNKFDLENKIRVIEAAAPVILEAVEMLGLPKEDKIKH